MAVVESLRPNRSLLNAKFDSYKLSPDPLKLKSTSLATSVNTVTLKDDIFSHLHVKAFGWTNHLVVDQWNEKEESELLYFVDENNNVNQVTVKDNQVQDISSVFQIPPVEEKAHHQLNAFITFPNKSFAFASDGGGRVYILGTGDRLEHKQWEVLLVHKLSNPFSILHSSWDASCKVLSCLLLSVTNEGESESVHVKHTVVLTFLMFYANVGEKGETQFVFDFQKEFHSNSVPVYAAVEPGNKAILVAGEKPFSLAADNNQVAESFAETTPMPKEADKEKKPKKEYAWTQESDQITIAYPLTEETTKDDILFDVKTHKLKVSLKNGRILLDGELFSAVESDACTWTLEKQRLEITLVKTVADHLWPDVIKGNDKGQYKSNGANLELLEDMLNNQTNNTETLFNQGELEECDLLPEDVTYILRMDVKDGTVTHKTSLSTHQWLFTKSIKPDQPPAFCVRHDVDALLWQPSTQEEHGKDNWEHIGTLNAFGYVHASKKEQKFTSCSSDFSYAVICDVKNHIFTYYQPMANDSAHAEQKLVQLDDVGSDGIVGIQACKKTAFVLGKNTFFIVEAF